MIKFNVTVHIGIGSSTIQEKGIHKGNKGTLVK